MRADSGSMDSERRVTRVTAQGLWPIYTGYQSDSEWRSSLLFWCTRHWTIEHQNTCRRTAGL